MDDLRPWVQTADLSDGSTATERLIHYPAYSATKAALHSYAQSLRISAETQSDWGDWTCSAV